MSLDTRPEEVLLASSTALKALIASSSDWCGASADRTVSHANDGFARVLGCSTNELLSNTLDSLHHPSELRGVLDKFGEAQSESEKNAGGLCRLRSKEGCWLWFDFEISNHLHSPGMKAGSSPTAT